MATYPITNVGSFGPRTPILNNNFSNPTSIPNLALWLDAADSTSVLLSGSNVTQWNDKSGNGRNTTSIGRATYATSGINGLPCVSNIIDATGPIGSSGNSTISVFVVGTVPFLSTSYFNALALNSNVRATAATNFYTAGNMFTAYLGGQSPPIIYGFMGGGNMSLTYSGSFGQAMVWEGFQNGPTTTTFGNGTSYGTSAVTAANYVYNAYWLGGPSPSGPSWAGYLGEVLVYNRSITTTERQQIEGYLSWKWGTVWNLPSTHPYKNPAYAPFSYSILGSNVVRPITSAGPYIPG